MNKRKSSVLLSDVLDEAALDAVRPALVAEGLQCPSEPCTVASLLRQSTPIPWAAFERLGKEVERILSTRS